MKQTFRANGKLLISGEYFVLDGAIALGIPTRLGQRLTVSEKPSATAFLKWESFDVAKNCWFSAIYDLVDFKITETSDEPTAVLLQKMLRFAQKENPTFLPTSAAVTAQTWLEFPRNWGLGSSSTLVCLIAKWAKVDAFRLLFNSMKGSGYDIACGITDSALTYQLLDNQKTIVEPFMFLPSFRTQIYFVHLNEKQNSRTGIARYRAKAAQNTLPIDKISELTQQIIAATSLLQLNGLLLEHEELVAQTIDLPRAKALFFDDYAFGEVKSLGAWGGDFVLATSDATAAETLAYFHKKGFETVLSWEEMIL